MTVRDLLNVAYVMLCDELTSMVRAERQSMMIASSFSGNQVELPDPFESKQRLDEQLEAPLPSVDPVRTDLRKALGLPDA